MQSLSKDPFASKLQKRSIEKNPFSKVGDFCAWLFQEKKEIRFLEIDPKINWINEETMLFSGSSTISYILLFKMRIVFFLIFDKF